MAKISTSTNIDWIQIQEQGDTPATPASGYGRLYCKSDGLYFVDDAGTEVGPLAAAQASAVGSPTDWTPSVTQSGSVAVTVTYAKYVLIGNLCYVTAQLAVTGTGTGGNDIIVGNLPKTPAANGAYGVGWIFDNGTAYYVGAAMWLNAGGLQFRAHLEGNDIGSDPSFALANGDSIMMTATFPWT